MQDHVVRLQLVTDHWQHPLPRRRSGRRRSWTDQQLIDALRAARSIAGVMRELGVRGGGAERVVRARIKQLGLDTSHLRGQAWARGVSNPSGQSPQPLAEILVAGSSYRNTARLKERLIGEELLVERCAVCGIDEWNGLRAPLHLDHVNGDRRDHRLENLRLLCPNCHAQTDTYCGRNVGRYAELDD